jgi:hypothetical protein
MKIWVPINQSLHIWTRWKGLSPQMVLIAFLTMDWDCDLRRIQDIVQKYTILVMMGLIIRFLIVICSIYDENKNLKKTGKFEKSPWDLFAKIKFRFTRK